MFREAYALKKTPLSVFLAATVVIFFATLSAADSVGLVPYYLDGDSAPTDEVLLSSLPTLGEADPRVTDESQIQLAGVVPTHISIPSINLDLPIQNTQSHNNDVLNEALHSGPVRYMDSALLGVAGNMLIFAHSSHLPIVHNQMYKAFNRVPELKAGDSITVDGADGKHYLYSVTSVRKTDANEAVIDLSPKLGTRLTLSTCDTLTSKNSRFVAEADFVGVVGE